MPQNNSSSFCWNLSRFSIFYAYYAIIDTPDYLADQLFIRHQVRVYFGKEYAAPDAPYLVILCRIRKRHERAFLAAISELPKKMLLCGYPDYIVYCTNLPQTIDASKK